MCVYSLLANPSPLLADFILGPSYLPRDLYTASIIIIHSGDSLTYSQLTNQTYISGVIYPP